MADSAAITQAVQKVLGYLNFSSGSPDGDFLASLNAVFRHVEATCMDREASILEPLRRLLEESLGRLHAHEPAFVNVDQARAVLALAFDVVPAAYRAHHRDLLFHQSDRGLWRPFFLGRVCEAVLAEGPPWEERDRIVPAVLARLNGFIGYRPIPVLENDQRIEPYEHEWVAPIPLYIEGAGVAAGPYEEVVSLALDILAKTDPDLAARAWFSLENLAELAIDPRAYDFDHPVNKRPNYHFGLWDPHSVDNKGRYRRFVVQQVTLDALRSRVAESGEIPRQQLLFEAATVLAGTMLMASGTSGSGPDSHDSMTTLAGLLAVIAAYRDEFYERLLAGMKGAHAKRLADEAARLRQPFGAARQHLNQELTRRRATQLVRVHLAQLYARMGYPDAAMRQAETVRTPSARMMCKMYCRLTLGHRAIDAHRLAPVAENLKEIEDLLHRAIECGAAVDPWSVLGFGGNFSLTPAVENSIHDFRVDALIDLMEQIFALAARAGSEAAASDDAGAEAEFSLYFSRVAQWWDQFATPTVSGVKRLLGKEQEISTNLVAGALNAWHKAGAAAGDIAFWRMFVEEFDSPKAFQLVVEALLEKGDHVASMALLMQWLSQSARIPLEDGDSSFHRLSMRWMASVAEGSGSAVNAKTRSESASSPPDVKNLRWNLVKKFFDYMEANAEEFWRVPTLDLEGASRQLPEDVVPVDDDFDEAELFMEGDDFLDEEDEDDEDDGYLYSAAYDEMTFRDSTDDGYEGEMLEAGGEGGGTHYELEHESRRIERRLDFLTTLARLWKFAAMAHRPNDGANVFAEWQRQAAEKHADLVRLLKSVHRHRLPEPSGSHESMVEFDRRRMVKESLLERIVLACVEMADASRYLEAAVEAPATKPARGRSGKGKKSKGGSSDLCVELLRAVLRGNAEAVRTLWPDFLDALRNRQVLYVPLSKGGDPASMVAARATQQTLRDLLAWLPRLGLIVETCALLEAAQYMEGNQPIGPGAVTEFDRLFEAGHRAAVEAIVISADDWDRKKRRPGGRDSNDDLVEALELLTESQLQRWLNHSRTLRLSVVERLAGDKEWNATVAFIERYGRDLFTQRFLNLGNLRAILHQGVGSWLSALEEDEDADDRPRLIDDLGQTISRAEAEKQLTLVLEIVVENYGDYRDYNATTTQSDRGELLHTLIDFLRLRNAYDRVAWNLRPVVLAHEALVRKGRSYAAEIWRRALAERTAEVADGLLAKFAELSRRYGMRLTSISDRLAERFVHPLAIDRVRALVGPAMELGDADNREAFSLLEQEIEELAREPAGVGFDAPSWLESLEEEVAAVRTKARQGPAADDMQIRLPQKKLSLSQVRKQIDELSGGL